MRRLSALAIILALVILPATGASAADHAIDMEVGDTTTVEHGAPMGVNPGYFDQTGGAAPWPLPAATCSRDPHTYCETILVALNAPLDPEGTATTRRESLQVTLDWEGETSDFDLVAYASDAEGTQGESIGQSGAFNAIDGAGESVLLNITTTMDKPTEYVLLHVVYFAAHATPTTSLRFF